MAVGAFGALIDFGIANLLSHFFDMPLVFAGTISFACAVVSNFIWNRYWTYPESRSRPLPHQLGMFFAVNLAGVAIRIPILHFVEPPLSTFFGSSTLTGVDFTGFYGKECHTWLLRLELSCFGTSSSTGIGLIMMLNRFEAGYGTYPDLQLQRRS